MRAVLLTSILALGLATTAFAAGPGGARLIVRHEVSSYAAWRTAYDGFDATRRKMGVTAQAVYRSVDDANDITVTHDFKSAAEAKAFAASPELKAAMEKAHVKGAPQIWITSATGSEPAAAGGVRLFVRHDVADYAAWRKTYDGFDATRRKLGVTGQAVYRSVDDAKDVTVTHDFKTAAAAKAFAASPELKAAMEKSGVTGAPKIWFTKRAAG
jgi:quinol monooxygenase YgiN